MKSTCQLEPQRYIAGRPTFLNYSLQCVTILL